MSRESIFLSVLLAIIIFLSAVLPSSWKSLEGFTQFPTEYSTYPANQALDSRVALLTDGSKEKQCSKLFGFGKSGLFCGADTPEGIDAFYGVKGDTNCTQGSGYTNSKGSLCFNDKQLQLLSSRGGNLSPTYSTNTKDSQIG